MKILITGHNGFIGRNMAEWMTAEGWDVTGWDWKANELPDVKQYQWVIHLGAVTDHSDADVDTIISMNYEFSQALFNACNKHKVHFQYASSSEVYGHTNNFSEFAPCHPQTPYAWSKYLFDRWVLQQSHNAFVHGFRYFDVYGKYMYLQSNQSNIIHNWQEEARKTGAISVWDNADRVKRDWVWVGDVCKLHIDFIKTVRGSGLWNIGSGLSHSYLDVAEAVADQTDAVIKVVESESLVVRDRTCADLTHLKSTIGKRQWLNIFEYINR